MGRHSWSAGGHCLSPPDAPVPLVWRGNCAEDRKGEKNPNFYHSLPSSSKDAQLERCPCTAPNASSSVLPAPGDPGQTRDQPGLIVEETWMKREKQHAVLILC